MFNFTHPHVWDLHVECESIVAVAEPGCDLKGGGKKNIESVDG